MKKPAPVAGLQLWQQAPNYSNMVTSDQGSGAHLDIARVDGRKLDVSGGTRGRVDREHGRVRLGEHKPARIWNQPSVLACPWHASSQVACPHLPPQLRACHLVRGRLHVFSDEFDRGSLTMCADAQGTDQIRRTCQLLGQCRLQRP
jgi:redox-sensitive bicupin YhaK (pirin superfamily)